MAIKFVAILLVLLVCHLAPGLARLREAGWWHAWREGLGQPESNAALAIGIGLPVLLVALIQWLLHDVAYGLPAFAFAALVLYLSWGPRDLERDVEAIDASPDGAQRLAAAQSLRRDGDAAPLAFDAENLVSAVFAAALTRWFGVLFWFLVAGPAGAVLYRLAHWALARVDGDAQPDAQRLAALLDWLPAHLMVLALALASNFDAVFSSWRAYHLAHPRGYANLDLGFLDAIARASVTADVRADESGADAHSPQVALDDAMVLVRRVLVVWLTLIALIVIGGLF